MIQIKIISSSAFKNLEEDINNWLADNNQFEILNIEIKKFDAPYQFSGDPDYVTIVTYSYYSDRIAVY